MSRLLRLCAVGALLLLLGATSLVAQEVVFTSGPAVTPTSGASNGGFAWGDVNGDGILDVWIPSNNVLLNHLTYFTAVASTKTANLSPNVNSVGGLFADINGDGVLDIWSTNNAAPQTGLFYDSAGVYIVPTGTGDLAKAGATGSVFAGMAVADIDHSNYLSAAWHGFKQAAWSDGFIYKPGEGIEMLKGGPSGFTRVGNGAAPGNLAIDTTRAFETWDVHFIDANNDGYQDLLMPSFRHGYNAFDIQVDSIGARKGTILYLNDGTGKFYVPNATTLGRTLYNIDSISAAGVMYSRAVADTGIIVEDTVKHFNAIGSQWGDLNNDGIVDLLLTGTEARNYDGLGRAVGIVLLYGKGDGTFTYKWNGANIVDSGLPTSGSIRAWDIGDYNNDGIPDVYASTTFGATRLFRGNGNGTFTEVTTQDYVQTAGGGRAGGFVDYNNDGFLDIYNYTGLNSVLQKNSGNSNHWIGFTPVGTGHNLSAIGARFTVYTQGGTFKQYRWIKGEGNAAGHGEMRAVFGIGINTSIDKVDVLWPDGTTATYSGLAVDRYWTVKQGSAIPNMPSLVSPANGAVSVAQAGTLTWNPATDALGYNVQVSLDPTFANKAMLAVNASVTGTSYAYSLGAATKYYWRVAAVNGGFMSDYTAASNFTTAGSAAAAVPSVLSPASGSKDQPAMLTLKVGRTADASRYQWQVSTLPTFTTFVTNDSTADTTYAGQYTGGQTFYLRVRGMNDLGASAFSAIDTFTIMTPPVRTTLVSPANNAQNIISDSVFFAWRLVSGAASYNLKLSTVNSTNTYTGITDTTYRVNNLAKLTNYTWMVEAINAGGTSYYTGSFTFTTIVAAPAVPSANLPASAATGVDRRTTFTWGATTNATRYRLQVSDTSSFSRIVRDTTVFEVTACTLANPLSANSDYYWQVRAENIGGASGYSTPRLFTTGTVLGVADVAEVPKEFNLLQNYPNPFNPSTTISFDVPKNAHVSVVIYDVLGRVVTTLVDEMKSANRYRVVWDASHVSTGVYFYRMTAKSVDGTGDFAAVKKLVLMK
jgi:ASPIC and UnbV/FG-GAP-like repeat/Secretion system C-terminal sorting domain